MPELRIALCEGFADDMVVVRAAGAEVYRRDGVRTDYSHRIADRFAVEVPAGPVRLEVDVPTRALRAVAELDAGAQPRVEVVITPDGSLSVGPPAHPGPDLLV